jgi:hypothetical protein
VHISVTVAVVVVVTSKNPIKSFLSTFFSLMDGFLG